MRDFSQLPDELVTLLMDIGSRKLVLLEGNSDCAIFHIWFADKHVLHHIFRNSNIIKMSKDVFVRTLAGAVRDNPGLHSDIKTIVEERILA